MGLTVQATCNRYQSVLATIPAFVTALRDLGVRIQNIRHNAEIQAGKTGGITVDKQRLKTTLCEKAFEIAAAVGSYASTVKNVTLAGKVKFTKSDLIKSRDTETSGLCQNIRAEATANLAALADYGVSAADLTDLAQKIATYEAAVASPKDASVSKKTAMENIDREFDEFDNILKNWMDPLIAKFAAISPAFVSDYENARKIVVSGGGGSRPPSPTPPSPTAPPTT